MSCIVKSNWVCGGEPWEHNLPPCQNELIPFKDTIIVEFADGLSDAYMSAVTETIFEYLMDDTRKKIYTSQLCDEHRCTFYYPIGIPYVSATFKVFISMRCLHPRHHKDDKNGMEISEDPAHQYCTYHYCKDRLCLNPKYIERVIGKRNITKDHCENHICATPLCNRKCDNIYHDKMYCDRCICTVHNCPNALCNCFGLSCDKINDIKIPPNGCKYKSRDSYCTYHEICYYCKTKKLPEDMNYRQCTKCCTRCHKRGIAKCRIHKKIKSREDITTATSAT
jgi:hypothetical protein